MRRLRAAATMVRVHRRRAAGITVDEWRRNQAGLGREEGRRLVGMLERERRADARRLGRREDVLLPLVEELDDVRRARERDELRA